MARIKIKDLPKDMKISKEEMKKVVGGALIPYDRLRPFSTSASLLSKLSEDEDNAVSGCRKI